MAALVPELTVSDFPASLAFYRRLGWLVVHDRPEDDFACLRLGEAELMIDGLPFGRTFDPTLTAADRPFGRGMNLEITVPSVAPLLAALEGAALHLPVEEKWYRAGDRDLGVRQFVVADPDGYLLRFSEPLGSRPHAL